MRLAAAPAQGARRATFALAGLLLLVGIVAIAAAGRAPATGEKVPTSNSHNVIVDYVSTLMLLILPIGAVIIIWMAFLRRGEIVAGKAKKRSWLSYLIVLILVLALIALRASHPNWLVGSHGQSGPSSLLKTLSGRKVDGKTPPQQPRFQWVPVLVLGGLAFGLVVSGGALALRRRRGTLGESPITIEAELSEVLDESIDDLRNEPDPRKAVIRTYARMERIFAAHGAPKEPFEAPLEYLGRALDIVQASAHSAARVTKLFERARFSTNDVDAGMKDDAIGALVALRSELAAVR
jgi:hypothetical protein